MVGRQCASQSREVRGRLGLHPAGPRLFDLLQKHDVGVLTANVCDRQIQIDRAVIRAGLVPVLSKLDVELQDLERKHGAGGESWIEQ